MSRQEIVDTLRRAGFPDAAEKALHILPDPVDLNEALALLKEYGVDRDELVNRMGGSP
jgi:hypothetical protein